MTWPEVLSILLCTLILTGAIGIGLVIRFWSSAGRHVSDLTTKISSGTVKLFAGGTTLGGAYAVAQQKEQWWFPAIAGLVCVFVWEALEKLIDNRIRAADRQDKETLRRAEQEVESRTKLL